MSLRKSCCVPRVPALPSAKGIIPDVTVADRGFTSRFISVPGGRACVGTDTPLIPDDGEGPQRFVRLKPFSIDPYAVTNAWFAEFVAQTGYRTAAELYGWSLVFWDFADPEVQHQRISATPWWCKVDGADWSHPYGPNSTIDQLADHPVTHVSWNDANAFCNWAGVRLPSEAEWECAAQKTTGSEKFPWGDMEPDDAFTPCNIWQGTFPNENTALDGFAATAPVGSFSPDDRGLFDMSGNVWEWCNDPFFVRSQKAAAKRRNAAAKAAKDKVLKGGSYLCHKSYCYRYRIVARTSASPESSSGHMGFRVVI